jgi:hypothetical protein
MSTNEQTDDRAKPFCDTPRPLGSAEKQTG